jgi:hypothetical protein
MILSMLKFSGLILQRSERIGLPVMVGFFISVKNNFASTELWVDENFEMIAVEMEGMDLNI